MTFDIDVNGILHVSAKDKGTGKEQKISIEGSSGLSDDEIEKAKREAEEHADADKARQEAVEVKNEADNLAYTTEKQLNEAGDKLSDDEKKPVVEARSRKSARRSRPTTPRRSRRPARRSNAIFMPLAQKIYASEAGAEGAPTTSTENAEPEADEPKAGQGQGGRCRGRRRRLNPPTHRDPRGFHNRNLAS